MEEIEIKRGDQKVTFRKVKYRFAVRLNEGRANDEKMLESELDEPEVKMKHIESVPREQYDVFGIDDSSKLEKTMEDLRKIPNNDVTTHLYTMDEQDGEGVIPLGTLTIQFREEVKKEKIEEILRSYGLEIVEEIDFIPRGLTVKLTSASDKNPLKIAHELQNDYTEEVEIAEPDLGYKVKLHTVPGDTLYPYQWHLNNIGNLVGLAAGADVSAEEAWDITMGSRDIVICVIDDGFDLSHPDLGIDDKIVAPMDFGQRDDDPMPVSLNDRHGTACAGVAVAEANGQGVVGLAPQCSLMPIRFSSYLSDSSIVEQFRHAMDNGADVISCSWGASNDYFPLSTKVKGIIHKAATLGREGRKGCVILFAAGNDNGPLRGKVGRRKIHRGFALHPDVIAVAACNSLDERSYYSNYGKEIWICAPSSGSPGRGILTTDVRRPSGYNPYGDYTYDFGGTSSATPLAAGLAGLMLTINPDLTSNDVKRIMAETADKIDTANGNYDANGHSEKYGYGRINAHEALKKVRFERLPKIMRIEHIINIPILDLRQIELELPFPIDEKIRKIDVEIDIEHTYRGDLIITLIPPIGNPIVLENGAGGSLDDLKKIYTSTNLPNLFNEIISKKAKGTWKLKVFDRARYDEGILKKWSLSITY